MSKFSDPDFSFEANKAEAAKVREIKRQIREDRRRSVATGKDPHAKTKKPWAVEDGPVTPNWSFVRDKDGKVTSGKQNLPIASQGDSDPKNAGKRFLVRIDSPCLVNGQHIDPGAVLECFPGTAYSLHGTRGQILKEFTPAA